MPLLHFIHSPAGNGPTRYFMYLFSIKIKNNADFPESNLNWVEPISNTHWPRETHLVHGQVNASVRQDAQDVGQVALVEGP